jgi:hypothetical protein
LGHPGGVIFLLGILNVMYKITAIELPQLMVKYENKRHTKMWWFTVCSKTPNTNSIQLLQSELQLTKMSKFNCVWKLQDIHVDIIDTCP